MCPQKVPPVSGSAAADTTTNKDRNFHGVEWTRGLKEDNVDEDNDVDEIESVFEFENDFP